ncbi:MAG TPA: trehalose-phosphatase [Deltaproteobacteria bacterium]|nr:trehalose-phosphatase [Deltaproteobacteria bacterium]
MTPQYYFDKNPLNTGSSLPPLALFLDFDGTLTPIQQHPDRATVKGEIRALLTSILGTGKSVLAILSGRPLADLEKRISIQGAYYAGSHGLEIKGPGMRYIHEPALSVKPVIDKIRHNLALEIERLPGVRIEEKPFSFALHYRGVPNRIASMAQKAFYGVVETIPADAPPCTVMAGKKVLELVPCPSWNKGAAALHIMAGMDKEYLPVCLGDDVTDETLFETFRGKGVTIKVGPLRNSVATYYLNDQREVLGFLQNINDLLSPSEELS